MQLFPRNRIFSNKSALRIRWPTYWSFSFSIVLPMNVQGWFPLGWTGLISMQSMGLSRVFSSTTIQKHQFSSAQPSLGLPGCFRQWRICLQCKRTRISSSVGKIPWRREWLPTAVFLPGELMNRRAWWAESMRLHRAGHNWVTNTFVLHPHQLLFSHFCLCLFCS